MTRGRTQSWWRYHNQHDHETPKYHVTSLALSILSKSQWKKTVYDKPYMHMRLLITYLFKWKVSIYRYKIVYCCQHIPICKLSAQLPGNGGNVPFGDRPPIFILLTDLISAIAISYQPTMKLFKTFVPAPVRLYIPFIKKVLVLEGLWKICVWIPWDVCTFLRVGWVQI